MKHKGRPPGETPKVLLQYLQSMASPNSSEQPTPQSDTSDFLAERLHCPICTFILNRPVEISCGAVVCLDCCCKWIQFTPSLSCPCCYSHSLNSSTIHPASPLIVSIVEGLLTNCRRKQYLGESTLNMTIQDVLSKPTTSPATPAELKVTGHLVRKIITSDTKHQGVVKVPTGGQVSEITLIKYV